MKSFSWKRHLFCISYDPIHFFETLREVLENEKLKREHEPGRRVFPRYFEFSQTFASVSRIVWTVWKHGKCFLFLI